MDMDNTVTIFCKNNKQFKDYPMGVTLLDIYKDLNDSNLTNFVSLTNKLINKGYNTLEINSQ